MRPRLSPAWVDVLCEASPQARPSLEGYLRERRISYRAFARRIGRSHEYVRRLCLPFMDPKRIVPDGETAALIAGVTHGVILPAAFGPQRASPRPGSRLHEHYDERPSLRAAP